MRIREYEKEERSFPAVTGASSLLVIFSVLCLTVFSLLSLSTVSADHRIEQENMRAIRAYYAADLNANEILSEIRAGKVREEMVSITEGEGYSLYEYEFPAGEDQILKVKAKVYDNEGSDYEILQWQLVNTKEWEPDTDIPVWNGD